MDPLNIINNIKKSNDMIYSISQLSDKELEIIITYAADKYYNSSKSIISDNIYDIFIDFLRVKNPKSKILKNIGSKVKSNKVKLDYWLGSMDKIKYSTPQLSNWIEKYNPPYNISDKLDGISALVIYNDNKIKMFTRGDSSEGSDITELLKYIKVPSYEKIKKYCDENNIKGTKNLLAIRGEIIMKEVLFQNKWKINFKNSRNTISGLVNSKKINPELALDTDLIIYELVDPFYKIDKQFDILKDMNFNIVNNNNINCNLTYNLLSDKLKERKENNLYKIDGIIITCSSNKKRNIKGNPDYAFAYKDIINEETTKAIVLDIEWNISKDGYIIPTILIEPIIVNEVEIKRTAGFNAKFIVDNKLGPGADIEIIRSGDVIPHIVKINKPSKSGKPLLPKGKWHWNETKVDIILDDIDNNIKYIIKNIYHFFFILKAKGLGMKNIEKIVLHGINTIPKILSSSYNDFIDIDNFKKKTIDNILLSIKNCIIDCPLYKIIIASNKLGHGIGEEKIKQILSVYPNILIDYKKWSKDIFIENISNINGWDIKTSSLLVNKFPDFIDFYNSIKKFITIKNNLNITIDNEFNNKVFVFTGFRDLELENIIKNKGGKISNNISKNTDYLVCKNINENSAKINKAIELKINIIEKDIFIKKFNL